MFLLSALTLLSFSTTSQSPNPQSGEEKQGLWSEIKPEGNATSQPTTLHLSHSFSRIGGSGEVSKESNISSTCNIFICNYSLKKVLKLSESKSPHLLTCEVVQSLYDIKPVTCLVAQCKTPKKHSIHNSGVYVLLLLAKTKQKMCL